MITNAFCFRRIRCCVLVLLAILALPACGDEDDAEPESYVVGILNPNPYAAETVDSFKTEMFARGRVDGETITYVEGASAQELSEKSSIDEIDLLLAVGGTFGGSELNSLTQAKTLAGSKIPIVVAPGSGDPVKTGDAETLAQPGRNITGLLLMNTDTKRFELFLDILPAETEAVALIYDPNHEGVADTLPQIEALAQQRGLDLLRFPSPSDDPEASEQVFAAMPEDVDGIFMLKVWGVSLRWFDWAFQHRVPTSQDARFNGPMPQPLMTYGPSGMVLGSRAANFADQILKGARAGGLPMQFSDPILWIDLGVADGMGFEVSEQIVSLADEISHTDVSVFSMPPAIEPVNLTHPAGTGACAAEQVTMGGSFNICIVTPCETLPDSGIMKYENKTEVGGCTVDGLVGVCATSAFDIHYYSGDPGSLKIGCGFQTGQWRSVGS